MTHDCNQNIESDMTPAHCSVCGKEIPRTLEEEREAIVEKLSNFIHRANTSVYESQEAREIDIKNSISHALLSYKEQVVARVRGRINQHFAEFATYYLENEEIMISYKKYQEILTLPITDENV